MSYDTAVTDRDAADIAAQNSKAFFNVADWTRIDGNTSEANSALDTALGWSVSLATLPTPTTATIPTVTELNALLVNIELLRSALSAYITDADFIEIKDDWLAGQSEIAPNYINVNQWERVTDIIYQIYKSPYVVAGAPICGVAVCGATDLGV